MRTHHWGGPAAVRAGTVSALRLPDLLSRRFALRRFAALAAVTGVAFAAGPVAPAEPSRDDPTVRVRVTLSASKTILSATRVPVGKVTFLVRNLGPKRQRFAIAGRRTRLLARGGRQTITVRFSKPGVHRYLSSAHGETTPRSIGVLRIVLKAGAAAGGRELTVALTKVADGFQVPVQAVAPSPGSSQLAVVEQRGLVWLLTETGQRRIFLDLRPRVGAGGEKGLLSLAFAVDYARSGLFYAYYNDTNGDIRVAEFRHDPLSSESVDSTSSRELLKIEKFAADHNGGMMQFGRDGYLYIAIGDGGYAPPVHQVGAHAQRLDDLFGTILRIDPRSGDPYSIPRDNPFANHAGARAEIYAYGLRNPWRFWIDARTGDLLVGDVGADSREEVNRIKFGWGGLNFGWSCLEGTLPYDRQGHCEKPAPPLYEYGHSPTRCSITGGVVVNDPRLAQLDGLYLFGDLCAAEIYALDPNASRPKELSLGVGVPQPLSFGVDGAGRVLVTSAAGSLHRVDPA